MRLNLLKMIFHSKNEWQLSFLLKFKKIYCLIFPFWLNPIWALHWRIPYFISTWATGIIAAAQSAGSRGSAPMTFGALARTGKFMKGVFQGGSGWELGPGQGHVKGSPGADISGIQAPCLDLTHSLRPTRIYTSQKAGTDPNRLMEDK